MRGVERTREEVEDIVYFLYGLRTKPMDAKSQKPDAPRPRNFSDLQRHLHDLHKRKTLRQIATENFNGNVNHAVIQRCLEGKEPRQDNIREALGLALIAERNLGRDPVTGQYVSLKDRGRFT
jgi:hypothetical protein